MSLVGSQQNSDAKEEYVNDALLCVKIKFVNDEEEINNEEPRFPIEFAYVQFGDLEKIYGYKELDVTLAYTQATMFPHLIIKYSEMLNQGTVKADEIYPDMESELVHDQKESLRSLDVFKQKLKEQVDFQPSGTQIAHFIDEKRHEKKYALFRIEGEGISEKDKLFLERIQSILFFYIEKVSYTDVDDEKFKYYVLYEVYEDSKKVGSQYKIVGYASLYPYFSYPESWRMRFAHTYVFLQYRKMGMGASFLHAINADLSNMPKVYDTTAETPAPEFVAARDFANVLELIEMPEFSKDNVQTAFTDEKAEAARLKWKMYKKQALRAHDILQLAVARKNSLETVDKLKEDLLARIKKPFERKTKEYKRMEMALTPEEMDLITANQGDKQDEQMYIKTRNDLVAAYLAIIGKLEIHSNKFNEYLKN